MNKKARVGESGEGESRHPLSTSSFQTKLFPSLPFLIIWSVGRHSGMKVDLCLLLSESFFVVINQISSGRNRLVVFPSKKKGGDDCRT